MTEEQFDELLAETKALAESMRAHRERWEAAVFAEPDTSAIPVEKKKELLDAIEMIENSLLT